MTASRTDIEDWYDNGIKIGATHLIVGYDWFDHENFPVYVMPGESCVDHLDDLTNSGNRYDEVYDFRLNKETQMAERRAIHIPNDSKKRTTR